MGLLWGAGMPRFESWLCFLFQHCANAAHGRLGCKLKFFSPCYLCRTPGLCFCILPLARVIQTLLPIWELWIGVSSSWVWPLMGHCKHLVSEPVDRFVLAIYGFFSPYPPRVPPPRSFCFVKIKDFSTKLERMLGKRNEKQSCQTCKWHWW